MNVHSKTVLVVDDDEGILTSVQIALEDRGYEVLTARDGAEGLVRAERDAPDVIVLDVVLPKRSGINVLDRLHRSHFRRPPIIMLTANDEPRHRDFAASCGVDAFFAKPFEMADLISKIDGLVQV